MQITVYLPLNEPRASFTLAPNMNRIVNESSGVAPPTI